MLCVVPNSFFSCVAVSSLLPLLHTIRWLGLAILFAHALLTTRLLSTPIRARVSIFSFLLLLELAVLAVEMRAPHLPFAPLALRSCACACANAAVLLQLWRMLRAGEASPKG